MSLKKNHIFISALALLAITSSCSYREQLEPNPYGSGNGKETTDVLNGDNINFVIGNSSSASPMAKSLAPESSYSRTFLGMVGQDTLYISSIVEENLDLPLESSDAATKGAVITSVSDFYISAFIPEKEGFDYFCYFRDFHITEFNIQTINEQEVFQTDYYWPTIETLNFHATNYAGAVTYSSAEENTFAYTLPAPDTNTNQDALGQKDYVFAISPERTKDEGLVQLNFAHALSAVRFMMGDFLSEEGRQVQYVKINNVPSSATCTFGLDKDENMVFDWTDHSNVVSYQQNISSSGTDTNVANDAIINDGEMTFMLIPHTINDDATIEIAIKMHDEAVSEPYTIVVSVPIKNLFGEGVEKAWAPGKKYTYVLSHEETVDLEITDVVEANVKGDLNIKNTGTAIVYVRAAIVGWWENEAGVVVAPWTESDGEFTGAAWDGGTWTKKDDGFYYYNNPVAPGTTTDKLFETYTLTATPPTVDSKLILTIASQAVQYECVGSAW